MDTIETILSQKARSVGFAMVGFARLRRLRHREGFFRQWLDEGRSGEMGWLAREPERRLNPRALDPRLRSVISLAYPYSPPPPPPINWRGELRGRIASYALGPDYHDTVLAKARTVAQELFARTPSAVTRTYVDTGPVFEREWAAEAGLGWFGRNTNLINRYRGSYFFLAEIFTDLELEPSEEPYRDHCGTCRQCLDRCPTDALSDGYRLEPRLCISYLTIEHRGSIPIELRSRLGNWIFGCDICQEVCPWNSDAANVAGAHQELAPRLEDIMALDQDSFRNRYGKSAVKRTKRAGLLRNAAIALGNSGNPEAISILTRVISREPEAIVRAHAAWALGRFVDRPARQALEVARRDPDFTVRNEAEQALAGKV